MKKDYLDELIARLKSGSNELRVTVFLCIIFISILFWIVWAVVSVLVAKWAGANGSLADAGVWGDSFGPFSAFFSALGFFGVFFTLLLQSMALEEQQNDQHLIRFEATFFKLLDLMRELRTELSYRQSEVMRSTGPSNRVRKGDQRGFNAIKFACYEINFLFDSSSTIENRVADVRGRVSQIYMQAVHRRFESRFAPYFRVIYTILHKIREDPRLNEGQKAYYGNLVRAQLTSHEIALLGFNATATVAKDLDEHLTYFRMFKYLPAGRSRAILEDVYPAQAFAART